MSQLTQDTLITCAESGGVCGISGMPIGDCELHPGTVELLAERRLEQRLTDKRACQHRGEIVGYGSCSCSVHFEQPVYRCSHPEVGTNCVDLLPPSAGITDCRTCPHGPHLRS